MRIVLLSLILCAAACDQTSTKTADPAAVSTVNGAPVNADNTKLNERDRQNTLTPLDQGGSTDEIKFTAAARQNIMGDARLSTNAKNVKVITNGTKVTLRGPVATDQEKAAVEADVKQVAGVTAVDNQIEVKK